MQCGECSVNLRYSFVTSGVLGNGKVQEVRIGIYLEWRSVAIVILIFEVALELETRLRLRL